MIYDATDNQNMPCGNHDTFVGLLCGGIFQLLLPLQGRKNEIQDLGLFYDRHDGYIFVY